MNNILLAKIISYKTHQGQLDKGGMAYYKHPVRIAKNFKDKKLKILALLHDVLEDGDINILDLNKNFSSDVLEALTAITRDINTEYMDYIKTVAKNQMARAVKIADLKDNMDLTRLKIIKANDIKRTYKYLEALNYLITIDAKEVK